MLTVAFQNKKNPNLTVGIFNFLERPIRTLASQQPLPVTYE